MEGKTFGIIMQLVSVFSKDPTTLRQEMPVLPLIPPEQIVDYLDLTNNCYAQLWQEASDQWKKRAAQNIVIQDKDKENFFINPTSTLGYLVNLTKAPLERFERNLEKQIFETIEDTVDEADRSTLTQAIDLCQYIWKRVGPWIKPRLIDGAMFSYLDQQQYLKAAEFAYLNMGYFGQALKVHRDLLWLAPKSYLDRSKDDLIKNKEREDRLKFWLWQERFSTTIRVNHVLHHLTKLCFFYHELNCKAHEKKLYHLSYRYLTLRNIYNNALGELKASHHNHLAQSRSKNWFGEGIEWTLNFMGNWFLDRGYFQTTKPFFDVLENCEKLATDGYDGIKPYQIPKKIEMEEEESTFIKEEEKAKIEDILPKYINAIEADNFIEAKKYCTWYRTEDSEFNWLLEYQDLENYYQYIQKIFYFQDLFAKSIVQLYVLSEKAFDGGEKEFYTDLILLQDKIREEIHNLHHHRRKLKRSYLNYIDTKLNNADKSLWTRIKASVSRKAIRYFKDGVIYHEITPYDEQLTLLHKQLIHTEQLFTGTQKVVLKGAPKDVFFDRTTQGFREIIKRKEYSPFILTQEKFIHYFKDTNLKEPNTINVLCENVERNRQWFPNDSIWRVLKENVTEFNKLSKGMQFCLSDAEKLTLISQNFELSMSKVLNTKEESDKQTLELIISFVSCLGQLQKNIRFQYEQMQESFLYTMESIFNQFTPIDAPRVLNSLGRKTTRFFTTGQVLNQQKVFLSEVGEYQENIEVWLRHLKGAKVKLAKMKQLLKAEGESEEGGKSVNKVLIIENYRS